MGRVTVAWVLAGALLGAPVVTTAAAETKPARAAKVEPAAAGALVDAWLAAQNGGDFAAYEALYARRFEGIKRAGPRTTRFDRAGWVADRARMFKKPMKVTADDRKVSAAGALAVVTFTQTWSSGKFEDRGPKQLLLVEEGGGLRIAREEMLASTLRPPEVGALDAARLMMVIEGGHVVLDATPGDLRHAAPEVTVPARVAEAALLDLGPWQAWEGREVVGYGAQGEVCRGKLGRPRLLARAIPHFGVVQGWEGREEGTAPAPPAQIAAELWDLAGEAGRLLVAPLAGCERAVYARPADAPAPAIFAAAEDAALEKRARNAFRALPAHKAIQTDFASNYAGKGPWDGGAGDVVVFRGPTTWVAVSARAGDGCGDFYGELWALWRLDGRRLVLLSDPEAPGTFFAPEAAADLDGDGVPELLQRDRLARPDAGVWRVTEDITTPFLDCPC